METEENGIITSTMKLNRNILLVGALVALTIGVGLYLISTVEKGSQRMFTSEQESYLFEQGEIKRLPSDLSNFVLVSASVEGRILEKPSTGDRVVVPVEIKTQSGQKVQVDVSLGDPNDRLSIVTAQNGHLPSQREHNIKNTADIVSLMRAGDPIQVSFTVQEITGDLKKMLMEYPTCRENSEFCLAYISEIETWYVNNAALLSAIESGENLSDAHQAGAVFEVVLFNNE